MGVAFDRTGSYRVPLAAFAAAAHRRGRARHSARALPLWRRPTHARRRRVEATAERARDPMSRTVVAPATPLALLRMTDGLVVHQALVRGGDAGNCGPAEWA